MAAELRETPAMADTSLDAVRERLHKFVSERDWKKVHTPRNLAAALIVETAELLELFQWDTLDSPVDIVDCKERIAEELADFWIYSLLLADQCNVDINSAILSKIAANAAKYPVEKARGRSAKYNSL